MTLRPDIEDIFITRELETEFGNTKTRKGAMWFKLTASK